MTATQTVPASSGVGRGTISTTANARRNVGDGAWGNAAVVDSEPGWLCALLLPRLASKPSSATRPVLTDTRRVPRRGSPSCQTSELVTSAAVEVAALLDDLAPACDAQEWNGSHWLPCRNPAVWLVWGYCPCGQAQTVRAACAYDVAVMLGGDYRHSPCRLRPGGFLVVTHTERIKSKP